MDVRTVWRKQGEYIQTVHARACSVFKMAMGRTKICKRPASLVGCLCDSFPDAPSRWKSLSVWKTVEY
jgi:hypothetical protein